jgi:hypothetical protein
MFSAMRQSDNAMTTINAAAAASTVSLPARLSGKAIALDPLTRC